MEENNLQPSEKPTNIFCTNCGKENNIEHKYCYNCGKELIKNENIISQDLDNITESKTEEKINEIIPEKNYNEYTLDELKILARQDYDRFYKIAKIYYEKDHEYYVNNIRPIINERNEKKVNIAKNYYDNNNSKRPKLIYAIIFIGILIVIVISIELYFWISRETPEGKQRDYTERNKSTQEKEVKIKTKEELFKESFPELDLISFNNSILIVKGIYDYTGSYNDDSHKINSDVWKLANKYPYAKQLKLNIIFKGLNRYGNNKFDDLGYYEINNLDEVRKYKEPEYYALDYFAGREEIFKFLYFGSKNSPYMDPYFKINK